MILATPSRTINPLCRYPRNLPCFCGSGIKFKKCHMNFVPKYINKTESEKLSKYVDDMIKVVSELKQKGIIYKKVEVNEDKLNI